MIDAAEAQAWLDIVAAMDPPLPADYERALRIAAAADACPSCGRALRDHLDRGEALARCGFARNVCRRCGLTDEPRIQPQGGSH